MKFKSKKLQTIAIAMSMILASNVPFNYNTINVNAETVAEFKDVPKEHVYHDVISEMVKKGIIKGYHDGTFKPNDKISRQHAAVLINRVVDLPKVQPMKTFNDIPKTHPYYNEIQNLQMAGLIQADSKGNFNPNQPLTRGEMAKIIAVAFNLDIGDKDFEFSDVEGTHYELDVLKLYSNGITNGYEDGTFKPEESLSRMHYAVFMYRAMNVKNKNDKDESIVEEPITDEVEQKENEKIEDEISHHVNMNYASDKEIAKRLVNVKKSYADVFEKDLPMIAAIIEANPISLEIYEKGLDILREYNMKIYDGSNFGYGSTIIVTMDGYQSPVTRLGRSVIGFSGSGEDKGKIDFDYRVKEAEIVAQHWLKIAFPELAETLSPLVAEKAKGARENQNDPNYANIELLYIDKYEIQIGVNPRKEVFILHIREPLPQFQCVKVENMRCKKYEYN